MARLTNLESNSDSVLVINERKSDNEDNSDDRNETPVEEREPRRIVPNTTQVAGTILHEAGTKPLYRGAQILAKHGNGAISD